MESKSEITSRHAADWQRYRDEILEPALKPIDEKALKCAKLAADCFRIHQDGERRSFLFAADERAPVGLDYAWDDGE